MPASKTTIVRVLVLLLLIPIGLSTRSSPHWYPEWLARYGGDTLWATLVTLLLAICRPTASIPKIAIAAGLFSLFIELSQLYHAPWIDAIRNTWPGGLVLGFDFLWSDLVCYAVGIGVGCLLLFFSAIVTASGANSD